MRKTIMARMPELLSAATVAGGIFRNQISITSKTAVGKTTLLRELKKKLDNLPYRWVSGGALMRARAASLGMTIEEFAVHNHLHPEEGHDRWCDDTIAHFAEHDWVICEGRLPHFFMPRAFKVLLVCNPHTRAARRQGDNSEKPLWQVLRDIEERDRNDAKRYEKLYPECLWPEENFDLVIETDKLSIDGEVELLLGEHRKWAGEIK